jgi:hypothetical protein
MAKETNNFLRILDFRGSKYSEEQCLNLLRREGGGAVSTVYTDFINISKT